jgi:hypothetical protein
MVKESYDLKPEGELLVTEIPSGSGQRYGFRRWTWGEKNALSAQCTILNPISGLLSYNSAQFNLGLILATVKKEVNNVFVPLTSEEINSMDSRLGERLSQITQQLNLVSQVEAQNL